MNLEYDEDDHYHAVMEEKRLIAQEAQEIEDWYERKYNEIYMRYCNE